MKTFRDICDELEELQDRKGKDYGTDADPLANIRATEDFGIPAWKGALLRANDKVSRIKTFCLKGILHNESFRDSMVDLVVYVIHAIRLYDELEADRLAAWALVAEAVDGQPVSSPDIIYLPTPALADEAA